MESSIKGTVAIITGAGTGIGAATARLFLERGARVVLAGRTQESLDAVADGRADALVHTTDVTDGEACAGAVAAALERFGRIDVLFNNAGVIVRDRTVERTSEEDWARTFAVNTTGTFLMSRAVLSHMRSQAAGVIVNNASYYGLVGGRGAAAYCASKGAVIALTKAMALDHAAEGIRINCICPGSVETPMLVGEMEALGGVDATRSRFEQKHPLGRIASPREIAELVVFLSSKDASYLNGAALAIDGGITAA